MPPFWPGMGMPGMGMPGMGMPGMGMPGMGMPGMGMPSLPMLQEVGVTRQKPMQTEEVTVDDVMNLLVESLGMFSYIFLGLLRAWPELFMPTGSGLALHFDTDPDPDPTPSLTHAGKSRNFLLFTPNSASATSHCFICIDSVTSVVIKYFGQNIEFFWKSYP
jgi:hypothetical protein